MKHSIDEYKNIMDRIEPSESFISETEKLMKKIRDEQYEKETNKEINKAEEIKISIVDNEKEDRVKRIKKWTIGVSAVAAAFVCVITVGYTGRVRVKENMTKPEKSETVETESEIASETSEKISETETTALTEETEAGEETISFDSVDEETAFDDEESVETEESFDNMAEEEALENTEGKPQDGINSKNSVVNEIQDGQTVTETASDDSNEEIAAEESEESEDNPEIVSYEEDGGESSESEYNTAEIPVYVPSLYEEYEDDEYDEYVYDGADSGYEDGVTGNSSISFLSVSYSEEYEKADEVYVPDSIAELDEGEYYIDVEAGYASYSGDEMTVPYISLSDSYSCGEIISALVNVTESCNGVYTETEQTSVNYRYKISIYSSDVNENNALLFEIYYDDEKVIFNRHDNDTVSSETYFIESENYDALTECIESIILQ